ncbi:MAG: PqqD family protein [Solirubrobacteraceae bacterium]
MAVDLERGSYYSIRGAGVSIWRALTRPATPDDVVARIATHFARSEAEVAGPVLRFISQLEDHGLLRPADSEATGVAAADPPVGDPATFEPPRLEKFTDMEDLLLLDPVHEVDARGWPHPDPH